MNKMNAVMVALLGAAALAAPAARADMLYWTIGGATYEEGGDPATFAYATVKADGDMLYVGDEESGGVTEYWKIYADPDNGSALGEAYYSGSFDGGSVGTFLVELWNADDKRVGWQEFDAADYVNSILLTGSLGPSTVGQIPLTVTSVVPEPTSGVLLMVGLALVGLRRPKSREEA